MTGEMKSEKIFEKCCVSSDRCEIPLACSLECGCGLYHSKINYWRIKFGWYIRICPKVFWHWLNVLGCKLLMIDIRLISEWVRESFSHLKKSRKKDKSFQISDSSKEGLDKIPIPVRPSDLPKHKALTSQGGQNSLSCATRHELQLIIEAQWCWWTECFQSHATYSENQQVCEKDNSRNFSLDCPPEWLPARLKTSVSRTFLGIFSRLLP